MSAKVFNHQTQKWELLNDADVDTAVRSGNYTFESGVKIPVVAEDGELGYVPSENLHEAFSSGGFRWQTQADRDVDYERQQAAIRTENAPGALPTFVGGLLSTATLGASDAVLPDDLAETRKAGIEEHGVADVAGRIAGAFVPLPVKGGSIAGAGTKISEKVGGLVKTTGSLTKAQKIVRGVGSTALGSAAEGAFYGLGEGISEAALGNSEDIVDNLAAGVGFGALTGGVFGAGFSGVKESVPFLQAAADKLAPTVGEAIGSGARKLTKVLGKPAISIMENKQAAKEFGDLVDEPGFREMVATGDWDEVRKFAKEARADKQAVEREGKQIAKDLREELKTVDQATAQNLADRISASGGDLNRARETLYSEFKAIGGTLDDYMRSANGPALEVKNWAPKLESSIAELRATGNGVLLRKADELTTLLQARTGVEGGLTQGDELDLLRQVKWAFDKGELDKLGVHGKPYEAARGVWTTANDSLKGYPVQDLAQSFRAYDELYSSYMTLSKVSKKHKGATFIHPEATREIAPILANLESLAPDLARIREFSNDAVKQHAAMQELIGNARQNLKLSLKDPVAVDALKEVISEIASQAGGKVDRLAQISKTLSGLDQLTPMEQAIRLQKALGKDVSKLEQFLPFQKQAAALERLRGSSGGTADVVKGAIGATIGSALGGIPGAAAGAGMFIAANPTRALGVLTAVERAANKGAQKLAKSFKNVTTAITSPGARTLGNVVAVKSEPMEKKRERFQSIMAAVSRTMTPEGAIQSIAALGGDTQGLNKIKTSLGQRLQVAALYLNQYAPKDPMAGKSLLIQDSGWQPSDTELTQFMRRVAVVNDPTVAIDRLAEGNVTLEEIDALKMVHPEVYASLQKTIITAIMDKGNKVPYQTRLLLGTVFGLPTDYSMTPEFVGRMQATYNPQNLGGRPDGATDSQPRTKNFDINPLKTVATETSQLTYGDNT